MKYYCSSFMLAYNNNFVDITIVIKLIVLNIKCIYEKLRLHF